MNKQLDFSVLNDGVLIEHSLYGNTFNKTELYKFEKDAGNKYNGWDYRLALDYWHFNDPDNPLILPKGLVIDVKYSRYGKTITCKNMVTYGGHYVISIVGKKQARHSLLWERLTAVMVKGVTPEFGSQLGMDIQNV